MNSNLESTNLHQPVHPGAPGLRYIQVPVSYFPSFFLFFSVRVMYECTSTVALVLARRALS